MPEILVALNAFVLQNLRFSIPKPILAIKGDSSVLDQEVKEHLDELSKKASITTMDAARYVLANYVADKIRYSIYEIFEEGKNKTADSLEPCWKEILAEYKDSDKHAAAMMDDLDKIISMRRGHVSTPRS